jgi:hypothetical protein
VSTKIFFFPRPQISFQFRFGVDSLMEDRMSLWQLAECKTNHLPFFLYRAVAARCTPLAASELHCSGCSVKY